MSKNMLSRAQVLSDEVIIRSTASDAATRPYPGVDARTGGKWAASYSHQGQLDLLGLFETAEQARAAVLEAQAEYLEAKAAKYRAEACAVLEQDGVVPWPSGAVHARRDRQRRRVQNETMDRARRRGYEWTGPELEIAARPDLTAREVALMLGRTYKGVRRVRERLRVDPRVQALAGM